MYHNQLRRKKRGKLGYSMEELRQHVRSALNGQVYCPYCNDRLTVADFSLDHLHPVSRGGEHELDNLIVCCTGCNQSKGSMNDGEFTALLAVMAAWPEAVRRDTLARLRAGGRMYRG
jgi:5-methylcytosine-specific restriction endonuclease McrA